MLAGLLGLPGLLALLGLLGLPVLDVAGASPAAAAPACAGETNVFRGVCYTTASGAQHWLGTITAADGRHFICVDFGKDARLGSYAKRSVKGASNQFGSHVGDPELRALSYAYAAYTSDGTSGSKVTDAALSLIAREVFADSSLYPRITIADRVHDAAFGAGTAVLSRARQIWDDATTHFGAYVVQVRGMPAAPSVGDTFDLTMHVQSSKASGSHPMSGHTVHETAAGFTINSGDGAVTDAHGDVTVNVTYRGPGTGSISASAVALPGVYANLAVPDDHSQQRGLIETAETVTVQAVVSTGATSVAPPRVHTASSAATVAPGAPLTDRVVVEGSPSSYESTVTATLFGPYSRRPGADDCLAGTAAGTVTFDVAGDGEYATPAVATKGPGYYVWQESFPADPDTGAPAVVTPCGVAEETTIVPATPALATQASAQTAVIGASISDAVTMTGALPGTAVDAQYRLLGPLAPAPDGSCAGLDWSQAAVAAQGAFTITAGDDGTGTATTGAETLAAAGCFTFVERGDATATSTPVDWTEPGVSDETVLVRSEPVLVTQIHAQTAEGGAVVHDLVTASGTGGAAIPGQWKLLGLPEPRDGGCGAVTPEQWAHAETLGEGTFTVRGDGTVKTGVVTLDRTLCVTYVEHGDATATTSEIAWTAPGIPTETTLVRGDRGTPAVPFVHVPAGIAGGGSVTSGRLHGHAVQAGLVGLLALGAGLAAVVGLRETRPRARRRRTTDET